MKSVSHRRVFQTFSFRVGTTVLVGISVLLGLFVVELAVSPGPVLAQSSKRIDPIDLGIREARGLLRLGKVEQGVERLAGLYQDYPTNVKVIQLYTSNLRKIERDEEAIRVYEKAIGEVDDPSILIQDLERLYREKGELRKAFQLCLDYQEQFGEKGRWVTNEMESLIRSDAIGDTAIELVEEAMRARPQSGALKELYIQALYFAGRSTEALDYAATLDLERDARGTILFRFANLAEKKGSLEDALVALDRTLAANPKSGLHEEVLYKQARVLRKMRRLDDVLLAYDRLVQTFPDGVFAQRCLLEKAQVLQSELNRKEEALVAYGALLGKITPIQNARDAKLSNEIHLAMANCHLMLGRPKEAGELFISMADQATDPAVRIEAQFQVCEMLFYQGRMTEAETKYYEIIDSYPTASWVNDALERVLLIGENNDNGGVPLTALAQSQYHRRLGEVNKGIQMIDEALESYPDSEASDNLLLQKSALLLDLGRIGEAKVAVDTLVARYPESVLAPRSLKLVGDYYKQRTDGKAQAQEIFTQILLDYPDSIEAPDARALLDELEGKSRDSSDLWQSKRGKGIG